MTNKINKAIIYDQFGIDVLCARKLKEIISPTESKQFIGEEILICDKDKAYGIIILNESMQLDINLFKNHFSRHIITEDFREAVWPGVTKFNAFSFRIKKIFKEPLEYIYKGKENLTMSKFVEGIDILQKGVIGYKDLGKAPIETSWDGSAERKKASVEVLKIICAWFDSEKADVKSSYKLPHHKAAGQHAAVWNGVKAAMGALLGVRGGTKIPASDRQGVYNHLKKHYKQFDKEVPVFKSYSVDELKSIFPELYKNVIEYEDKYKVFKNTECNDEDKELKNLFLDLYKLFTIRLSEKSLHNPKKKPKKTKCYNCESCFNYGSQKEVCMGGVACPICEAVVDQEGKNSEKINA